MLGEPLLRLATRKFRGPISVPVLTHGDLVLTDSLDIVRYADRVGTAGRPLFPEGRDGDVHRVWWLARDILNAGRTRTTRRIVASDAAIAENIPFNLPSPMDQALLPLTVVGAKYILGKYDAGHDDTTLEAQMAVGLEALHDLLAGRDWFVGDHITAADLAAVSALQVVQPMDERYVQLGEANQLCWRDPRLSDAFSDLIAWRDRVVGLYRT